MIKPTIILLITCLFFMASTSAQQQQQALKDSRYKKYAGRYGSNSGIVLFEDGIYLLYGYATIVFGTYRFEKERLIFSPDHQEPFEVFAHRNPSITYETRINFVGFERGSRTFVQLANDSLRTVFNEGANCFNAPFVYLTPTKMKKFVLAAIHPDSSRLNAGNNTSWTYLNRADYNDFIFIYNTPKREYEPFTAMITTTERGDVIKLSNYGGEQGYLKPKDNIDEQQPDKEILELKSQYDIEKKVNKDIIYANQHYKPFPAPETSIYTYDGEKNLYTDREVKENESYYMENQYNDPSYLRQYQKLAPQSKSKFKPEAVLLGESLFFTVCGEGSQKSYHYNGFIEYKIPH